jgi:hypothetical protein
MIDSALIAQGLAGWFLAGVVTESLVWTRKFVKSAAALKRIEAEYLALKEGPGPEFKEWVFANLPDSANYWEKKISLRIRPDGFDITGRRAVEDLIEDRIVKAKKSPPTFKVVDAALVTIFWPIALISLTCSVFYEATRDFWTWLRERFYDVSRRTWAWMVR